MKGVVLLFRLFNNAGKRIVAFVKMIIADINKEETQKEWIDRQS